MSASKNNERPTKKGRKMNMNVTFEKISNNVVVNCDFDEILSVVRMRHAGDGFEIVIVNGALIIDIHGKHVKIEIERHKKYAYISIIHNRVLLGRVKIYTRQVSYGIRRYDNFGNVRDSIKRFF